jgi:Na+/phosphate symporter
MDTIVVVMQLLIAKPLLLWIPPLMLIGLLLKLLPDFPNRWIPPVLFVVGFLIASTWAIQTTTETNTTIKMIDVFIKTGLGQGFLMSASAAILWDIFNGFLKAHRKNKTEKDKEEGKAK